MTRGTQSHTQLCWGRGGQWLGQCERQRCSILLCTSVACQTRPGPPRLLHWRRPPWTCSQWHIRQALKSCGPWPMAARVPGVSQRALLAVHSRASCIAYLPFCKASCWSGSQHGSILGSESQAFYCQNCWTVLACHPLVKLQHAQSAGNHISSGLP